MLENTELALLDMMTFHDWKCLIPTFKVNDIEFYLRCILGHICAQSLEFDKKCHVNLTTTSNILHYGCIGHLISGYVRQKDKFNGRKVQINVFPILIYEFNIYFTKRGGGSYWRGALVRRNMVWWSTIYST